MGLINRFFGRSDNNDFTTVAGKKSVRKSGRRTSLEQLEQRQMLSADGLAPEVLLGSTYYEESTSDDSKADILQVSFEGGAAGTVLNRVVIDGDKNGDGLTPADTFFDIESGGLGDFGAVGLTILASEGFEVTNFQVADGSPIIIFEFDGFEAGEKLVFSIDVDEKSALGNKSNAIAEGAEFEDSILTGEFSAAGFVDLTLTDRYLDFYDAKILAAEETTQLDIDLPPDNNSVIEEERVRTAGAVAHAPQVKLASISGYVYHDQSDDGTFDESEDPISGVTIELLDENRAGTGVTTVTNGDGYYEFINLTAGKYGVRETQPSDYIDGKDTAGSHGGIASNDIIVDAMLDFGDDAINYNFGELLAGSIAGRVHASNGPDCNYDTPEILLAGVKIELLDSAGTVIDTQFTDEQGRYKFTNLRPGEYQVRETQPSDYFDGSERAGTAGGQVSDDLITNIQLGSSQDAVDYDFCEHVGAMISGYVYHDRSDDGSFDSSESPIAGVTLKLLNEAGQETGKTAITDAAGFYKFNDLAPGKYSVMEVQPEGYFDGKDTAGSLGGDVSVNDMIATIMINFGDHATDNNFGELLPGSISGRVHASNDEDCDFEDPDVLLSGVVIELLDSDGNFITSTVTNAQGEYTFGNLKPGEYQVREVQPEGYYDGGQRVGTGGGSTTDASDLITNILVGSEQNVVNYDFCEHIGASISGYVYHDESDDGIFDPSEDPISGVVIELLDENGVGTNITTVTNAQGYYEFLNLTAGKYGVRETQPTAYFDGKDTVGSNDGVAGNDIITGAMLDFGDAAVQYNFGELLAASIAGRVHASNGPDCDFDNPDILLSGVQIDLLDASGDVIDTTFTDAQGRYKFEGLRPGEYQVRETQPDDYFDGAERVGTAGGGLGNDIITNIRLASAEDAVNYDFCEHVGAMISGYVYHDRSDDGSFDPSETPIAGVTLKLLNEAGEETGKVAVTDAQGFYKFNNLGPGKYTVMESQPDDYFDGKDTAGSNGGDVSVNDMIAMIMVNFGDHATDNNFGELLPGSISGRVHITDDPNCDPDDDEAPIPDVTIQLLNDNGEVIRTTKTDANGEYSFTNLEPGVYTVRELQPAGYFDGGFHIGTGLGSFFGQDTIGDIQVGSDQHFIHYDFCEMLPASLSGYVFIDGAPIVAAGTLDPANVSLFRDGLRTPDDTPLAGIKIVLLDGTSGDPIFGETPNMLPGAYPDGPVSTFTDENGFFEFDFLPGGTYAVAQIQPEDLIDGVDTPGTLGGQAINLEPNINAQGIPVIKTDSDPIATSPLLSKLSQEFGPNAIARIRLAIGQRSNENNFSEVRTQPGFIPPQEDPPLPPNPLGPPQIVLPPPPLRPLVILPETPVPIFGGSSQALGFTWHLSVINAGQPRTLRFDQAEMQLVASRFDSGQWERTQLDRAEWAVMGDEQAESIRHFVFGNDRAIPVSGDWDGDGTDEIGVFIDGAWFMDLNANGRWDKGDLWAHLGSEADRPVTGDWDGDGKTDIGIYGPAWPRDPHAIARDPGLPDVANYPTKLARKQKNMPPHLEDATSGGRLLRRTWEGDGRADVIDHVFHYGTPGDVPIAGDWNGDGIRTIGVFRDGAWMLDTDGDGRVTSADESYQFGVAGDKPAVGDWNGDGIDDIGVFRAGQWLVDSSGNRELDARDEVFELGTSDSMPIVGDWDGDGADEPGAFGSKPETIRISQKPQ